MSLGTWGKGSTSIHPRKSMVGGGSPKGQRESTAECHRSVWLAFCWRKNLDSFIGLEGSGTLGWGVEEHREEDQVKVNIPSA
jgi:hypothetical protein